MLTFNYFVISYQVLRLMLEPETCSEKWVVAAVLDPLEVGMVVDLVIQVMVDPVVMVGLEVAVLEARHMAVQAVLVGLQADQVVGLVGTVDKVQVGRVAGLVNLDLDQAVGLVDQDLDVRVVLVLILDIQVVLVTWEARIVQVIEPDLVGLALGTAN